MEPLARRKPVSIGGWLALAASFLFAPILAVADSSIDARRGRARSLIAEVERIIEEGDFKRIEANLEEASRLAAALADRVLSAQCLDLSGLKAIGQGDFGLAASRQQEALAMAEEAQDRRAQAAILAHIGHGYWVRADYASALKHHEEALAIQREIGDRAGEATTLRYIGLVYFKQGAYEAANEQFARALIIREQLGDLLGQSVCWEGMAHVERDRQAFARSLEYERSALHLRERLEDERGQARVHLSMGVTYLLEGALEEAASCFNSSLAHAKAAGDLSARASALAPLAAVRARRGEFAEALAAYEEALAIRRRAGDPRAEAWVLTGLASVYERKGDLDRAIQCQRSALSIWEAIDERRALASGCDDAGELYSQAGRYAEALASHRRALSLAEGIQLPYLSITLGNIARALARLGDSEQALAFGARAVEEASRSGNPKVEWLASHLLATVYRILGRLDDSEASYRRSIQIIERMRIGASPEDRARTGFFDDKRQVYADLVGLLVQLGRPEEALEVAERARARAFLELMAKRAVEAASRGTIADRASPHLPVDELVTRDGTGGDALVPTIPPPSLDALISESRRRGETVIEYLAGEQQLFILVVRPDGTVHSALSQIGCRALEGLVREARRALRAEPPSPPRGAADTGAVADYQPLLRRLHDLLIAPVSDLLPQEPASPIAIVPDGPLYLVSFAALIDGEGRYLVERHTLHYVPSMGVLQFTRRSEAHDRNRDAKRILLVGNPTMPSLPWSGEPLQALPEAETEVRTVAASLPGMQSTILTGGKAGENTVRRLLPDQTIIHFATHALIRDDLPLRSFLALAPETGTDGRLTVSDLLGISLDADLLVLSACNTGLGEINGDGVMGLSRAFLAAGSASVIVSLWRVADITASREMQRFYATLASEDGAKAAALRQAQVDMIAALRRGEIRAPSGRPLPEHPVLWAPFILVGEPR